MTKYLCLAPFFYIEVLEDGNVHTCCPAYMKSSIGNIFHEKINDIWNGEKARNIRRLILKSNYSYCNTELCNGKSNPAIQELSFVDTRVKLNEIMPLPKLVKFCHDKECNIQCITCRKERITNSIEKTQHLNSSIEKYYLPLLQNAEKVCMNGSGEVLASRHGRKLTRAIIDNYPSIKFDIHTNGLMCNKSMLEKLDLLDRLSVVEVSLHSSTQKNYGEICLGSSFDRVIANVYWLSEMKKMGKINDLLLFSVISSINYKGMAEVVLLAQKLGAKAFFWNYRNWGAQNEEEYKILNIVDVEHDEHKEFSKMLKNKIFNSSSCYLNPLLETIKNSID